MASDRIFGLIALITAVAYLAAATQIQTNFFSGEFLPKLFPYLIGCFGALSALFMIYKPDPDPEWPAKTSLGSMAVAVVVLAFYAVLLPVLGFIIPTFLTAALLSYQLCKEKKSAFFAGLGLSLGLFLVFKFALQLGNVVAFKLASPAKIWDAITILIPFIGH